MSINNTLSLSGRVLTDNVLNQKVTWEWEVLNMDDSAVFSNGKRVELPSTREISLVSRGNLKIGKVYKFVLTVRIGSRSTRVQHYVEVFGCDMCKPYIRFLIPNPKSIPPKTQIDPSSKVKIMALLSSELSASYEWSMVDANDEDPGNFWPISLTVVRGY